nr:immunoglobulin heavy chain junction region [Mus musculus]
CARIASWYFDVW